MTTNEEFLPVVVRLSKYRTIRISVDTPPDYQPSVVLRRDTYDSKTGQLKTLAISVSMRSLSEFINALADVESFAVAQNWIGSAGKFRCGKWRCVMSTSIDFATLKEAVALSTIVSETVQLKRCGRQQWKGLCPFHGERTPSFYVYDDTRAYHCFGCGAHGDALDWLQRARGLSLSDAVTYLGGERAVAKSADAANATRGKSAADAGNLPARPDRLPDGETLRKLNRARDIWAKALPPHGTPVERYLETRGVHLPDADVLRWSPCCPHEGGTLPAMVALMTEPVTDEFRGIHRTVLRPDGTGKADVPKPKMMLGGSGIIQLADIHDIGTGLGLAEGIETALSVMQVLGWGPVWSAGAAGNIASFPFLPATTLNVFADADANGTGLKAAHDCRTRWAVSAGEVFIHEPPAGKDWNDVAGSIPPCP